MPVSRDFTQAVAGYGLTTAEIFYRLPDYPGVLQTYVWQDYDVEPDFPNLFAFLDFWKMSLDGKLHSVSFHHNPLLVSRQWRSVDRVITFE
ncbi:protein usg [Asticcacaulis solisilvae]|uniref:protein usg n=1 Tax=Asticcacaulis solisilvae TaxID=1217274 RepID=UPI003FD8E4FA